MGFIPLALKDFGKDSWRLNIELNEWRVPFFSHERTLTGNGPVKQQFQSRQHIPGLWALKKGKSLRQALCPPVSVWRHLADSSTHAFPQAGSCRAVEMRIEVQRGWDTCSLQSRASEKAVMQEKRPRNLQRGPFASPAPDQSMYS